MHVTTIVVPCYNEARRLDREAFKRWLVDRPWARLLFVDDGSADDTRRMLRTLAEHDAIDVLPLSENQGKAEAVRLGMLQALSTGTDFVGYWDADLATPLAEVNRFRARLVEDPEVQLILGSRIKILGHDVRRSLVRHYVGRIAATGASWVLRLPVYDTQCGAKLLRAGVAAERLFAEPFLTKWMFDVELITRLIAAHPTLTRTQLERHLVEVPVRRWVDVGESKVTLGAALRAPWSLARIWWQLRPSRLGRLG